MLENLLESSLLLVAGMVGVFSALFLMAGMIWLMKSSDEWINALRIRTYARKVETKQIEDELNDEIVAVLAAAATMAVKRPLRIRKVRFLGTQERGAWAVTGRLNVMASHQITRRKT
jgi:Na+-transporting methylmalonyl-CoA/oxaloacetate decarboxylase gamma subunit